MKNLTVLENITVPFLLEEDKDEEYLNETALVYLKKLGISDLKNKYPYEISGGEAKRVSIIRALLNDPKILILDEPTTGLDKKTGKIIFDFIDEYVKKGNTAIIASHDESLENYGVETIKLGD
jgi:putative ABC transport system ATP-binding protein